MGIQLKNLIMLLNNMKVMIIPLNQIQRKWSNNCKHLLKTHYNILLKVIWAKKLLFQKLITTKLNMNINKLPSNSSNLATGPGNLWVLTFLQSGFAAVLQLKTILSFLIKKWPQSNKNIESKSSGKKQGKCYLWQDWKWLLALFQSKRSMKI